MPMNIRCPNVACGAHLQVPDSAVGKRVQCPTCKRPFTAAAAAVAAAAPRKSKTSSVFFEFDADGVCPACASALGADRICSNCGWMAQTNVQPGETEMPPNLCANPACGVANPAGDRACQRCGEPIPVAPGTLLHGRYRIDKLLKTGGFGAVYRALDMLEGNRPVAVKDMIDNDPKESAVRRRLFRREAKILEALRDLPTVPRFYDFIEEGKVARLVMEFIHGIDLREKMRQNDERPFPISQVIEWGKEICRVLEAMHGMAPPLIHRDLKPDNIMLLENGRSIKIVDFGTARDLPEAAGGSPTKKTEVFTRGYAPMEQAIGKPQVRSDLYALAATLYHLATGREPNDFDLGAEIARQLNDPGSFIQQQHPEHRWFFALLRVNLFEQPEHRYASAAEFRWDLENERVAWDGPSPEPAPPPQPTPQAEKGEPEWAPFGAGGDDTEELEPPAVSAARPEPMERGPGGTEIKRPTPPTDLEPPPDPVASLRAACQMTPPDWWEILRFAEEARQMGQILPPELGELARSAQTRNDAFWRLQRALEAGKLEEIAAAYDPALLDDWPACADQVIWARKAVTAWKKVQELRQLVKSAGTGKTLLERWPHCAADVMAWPEGEPIRQAVLSWDARNRAMENLAALIREKRPSEQAIVQAWQNLQKLGGHPDAAPLRLRVEQAVMRAACLERLPAERVPEAEDSDAKLMQAWDETILADCPEAETHRLRYERAQARGRIIVKLDAAIAQVEQGLVGESAIDELARQLPKDYVHRHSARVKLARDRIEAQRLLDAALKAKRASDIEIAKAWTRAAKLRIRVDAETKQRCELAQERSRVLAHLEKIDPSLPLHRQDQQWIKLWNAKLLQGCADAERHKPRHALASERAQAFMKLRAAMRAKDFKALPRLAALPLLADYPPVVKMGPALREVLHDAVCLQKMMELLARNDPTAFAAELDFDHLRAKPELYLPHRPAIEASITRWLNETQPIGKGNPISSADPITGLVTVRWTWRHFGRISFCHVAVSPERFYQTLAEAGERTMRWDVESHRRAGGGMELAPIPGGRRFFVTVWPVVTLGASADGWRELVGLPLHLGPVRTTS